MFSLTHCRMSSEISQLCLEALSPLAEQCAKTQEKDTPLFIATRHFLKVSHMMFKPVVNCCGFLTGDVCCHSLKFNFGPGKVMFV